MENNELLTIPYVVYEQEKAHQQKVNLRWFIVVIILIAALIGTNLGWLIYESQFETVTETIEEYEYDVQQDTDSGDNNFIGHDGDVIYGETEN